MKHLFILFVFLMSLMGCAGIQTPVGTYSFNEVKSIKEAPKQEKSEPKKEKTFKEKSGMSPSVAVLLGIGAASMMMSIGAINLDDGNGEVFAVITGGTGLVLWGAAGIVALTEE